MSTFLELCKKTREKSGISGDGPSNVSGQTGMYAKIVEFVKNAHEEVQLLEAQWRFDWAEITQALTPGQDSYNPADWGLSVKQWRRDTPYVYLDSNGPNSRTWLTWVDWASMKHMRRLNVNGLPTYWTEGPDRKIYFYPNPQAATTLVAEYYKRPQVLVNNTDIPRIPEEYQMSIVWKATMLVCADVEDMTRYQAAEKNFMNLMMKMRTTELVGPDFAEPLA